MDDGKKSGGLMQSVLNIIGQRPSNGTVASWGCFFTASLMVYYFFSDGDFSFLLTYAGIARVFGLLLLNAKIETSKNAAGVSLKALECYAAVFMMRLWSILRHEGYLPYDRSGDWLYHCVEFASLGLTIVACYLVGGRYRASYDDKSDCFGNLYVPPQFGAAYLLVPCLLGAVIMHPNLNKDFISDMSWTFSMYTESLAIVPQLYMFQKQSSNTVEPLISHFVFTLGFARLVEMAFWLSSFHELASENGTKLVGIIVLVVQFVHIALMADFFYFYVIALHRGGPLQLPTQNGIV